MADTAHVRIAEQTGVEAEPLPEGCTGKEVEGGGADDTAWVVFFMDDAVSVEVQWEPGGEMLSASKITGIDSFPGHGGEGGRGGAPAVTQEGHGLDPTARGSGVRPGHGENDGTTASQEGPGVAEAARRVARGEEHDDS